jgi:membrane associated rhomboid family serine protease
LFVNSISLIVIYRPVAKAIGGIKTISLSILVAFLGSYIASYDEITLGSSGVVMAIIGIYYALIVNKIFRVADKKMFLINTFLFFGLSIVMWIINPATNILLHAVCMLASFVFVISFRRLFLRR